MHIANKIAVMVKGHPSFKQASAILMGAQTFRLIREIPADETCDPPDYNEKDLMFCGKRLRISKDDDELSLIVNVDYKFRK